MFLINKIFFRFPLNKKRILIITTISLVVLIILGLLLWFLLKPDAMKRGGAVTSISPECSQIGM